MGIQVTPRDSEARLMDYYGVNVWVRFQSSVSALRAKRLNLVSEMGMTEEEYEEKPQSFKDKVFGRAFVGTVVTHIEDFEVTTTDEDGKKEKIKFKFDAPSTMDEYGTQGEELLGEDEGLRTAVLERAVNAEEYRVDREVKSLGNLKALSASGG